MGEIEDGHTIDRLAGLAPGLGRLLGQTVGDGLLRRRFFRLQLHELLRRSFGLSLRFGCRLGFGLRLGFRPGFGLLARCHCRSSESSIDVAAYFLRSTLCGLRLPIRPLSLPAAGSITALMSVGLPESMASFTARLSSSGVVPLTPAPPHAPPPLREAQ